MIFDEIHKMAEWKRWLKGIYDVEGFTPKIIVTGSANLEVFTNVGDSLAGRYFRYRLHPLDIKEIMTLQGGKPQDIFQALMQCSGFPEPFLQHSIDFYKKWQKTHIEVILRQDFLDLYAVRSILKIELLVELLKTRITLPLSYTNLATDLQVSPKSVQSWMTLLENFFVLFKVTPYHRNVARAVLKEPKYYFFDIGRAEGEGARLENLVACALLKEIHFLQDTKGLNFGLSYLRNKDGVEIDFLITLDQNPLIAIEVKTADDSPSKAFAHFKKFLSLPHCFQLVANLARDFDTALPNLIKPDHTG